MFTSSLVSTLTDLARQALAALRLLIVFTVLLGVGYPLAVWAFAQPLGDRAAGQPVTVAGEVVGSALLGQDFTGEQWFHPRPSTNDYDTLASGPSNLGPLNADLIGSIEERRAAIAAAEGVAPTEVPADALTASASGLDPHISPAYADLQVARVARVNGLAEDVVRRLVGEHTQGRALGFLGAPGVNVVLLNAAILDATGTSG